MESIAGSAAPLGVHLCGHQPLCLYFPHPLGPPTGAPDQVEPCSAAWAPVGFTKLLSLRVFYWSPVPRLFCWPFSCYTVRGSSCMTSKQSRVTFSRIKMNMWTSSQDGGIGKHALPPCTTIAKITTGLQNKYHPDSSENQAVWKSDNQGFKEATFIQMGKRVGEVEWCGEVQRRGKGSPTFACGS